MIVIPTVSWSDEESYLWCFDGISQGGAVAVSSVGCLKNMDCLDRFMNGYNAMVDKLHPAQIFLRHSTREDSIRHGPVPRSG